MQRGDVRRPWVPIAAALGLLVLLAGAALVKRALDLPRDAAERTKALLGDVRSLAEAFRAGTVTTSFVSYTTEASGSTYLQFATLKQVEIFQRKETATILWGQLALPDVVVEARAPITYTYYLDLDKPWSLRLEDGTVFVTAPPIEFNTPAIDASAIRFEVREGSLFRDEDLVLASLKSGLTEMSKAKARQNVALVRELGRRKTEQFVEKWLVARFSDGAAHRARVVFPDEVPTLPPPR